MGGSDQWGNIVMGADLGRRMAGAELFALTTPLIATASGAKMGKTAAGAVWLNAERAQPYDFWQYWRNTEDADVGRFLKLFTELPLDEIARLEALRRPGDQRGQEDPRHRGHQRWPRRGSGRRRPPRPRAAPSRKAARPTRCPPSTVPRARLAAGIAGLRAAARGGPGGKPHRGAQADQGRRRTAERQADRRRHGDDRGERPRFGRARSSFRPAASATSWCARSASHVGGGPRAVGSTGTRARPATHDPPPAGRALISAGSGGCTASAGRRAAR